MTDARTFIKIHDGLPDHPKIVGLSDRSFRVLIELWCWSSRHLTDGHIPMTYWNTRGTRRARTELLSAGLVEPAGGGVKMHDYLEHQRSAAEVEQHRSARHERGSYGNHVRWHVRQGITRPNCAHCLPDTARAPHSARPTNGTTGPREHVPADKAENKQTSPSVTHQNAASSGSKGVPGRSHERSLGDPSASPETESETDTGDLRSPAQNSVDHHHLARNARARPREAHHPLSSTVVAELRALTGRQVTDHHASAVARQILDGRRVSDPRAYVVACLRGQPSAFVPPGREPSRRNLTEALTDALARHPCTHGAIHRDRCPMCRRARPETPDDPTATSINDDTGQPKPSDKAAGQTDDATTPKGEPGP